MSFLKSLKGLADDFKNKDKQKQGSAHGESNRGASDSYYQQEPQQSQNQHSQQYGQQSSLPPQQSHGGPPQQHQYGDPPPQQGYGAPPSGPHLPPGWIQQWDSNSQRHYYLEQATGRTQWEPPATEQNRAFGAPPPGQNYLQNQSYGHNQGYPPQGQGHGFPLPVGFGHSGDSNYSTGAAHGGEQKAKSNKGTLLAAGAGGLAVGGLAGAALADDSSDDETRPHHAATSGYGAQHGGYNDPSYGYGAQQSGNPQALEHNSDVSSSQRESLEEAREDYQEAQKEAADSDASSSDREELEEAQEDYQEETEEAEEEAYDD